MAQVAQDYSAMYMLQFNPDRASQQSTFEQLVRLLLLLVPVIWQIQTTRDWLSCHGIDKINFMTLIQILVARPKLVDSIHRLDDA